LQKNNTAIALSNGSWNAQDKINKLQISDRRQNFVKHVWVHTKGNTHMQHA